MRNVRYGCALVIFGMLAIIVTRTIAAPDDEKADKVTIEALFSPGDKIGERIVKEIEGAEKRIRIQAHYFTSKPIATALVAAKKRGVDVEVIFDKEQEKLTFSPWKVLRAGGVGVYFDREHGTANNKIVLIDKDTVITGSANLTKAADEKNAENIVIIKGDKELAAKYLANYDLHQKHSHKAGV